MKSVMHTKLLFFVTEDWYFCSHRLQLAISAKKAGYNVSVVTRVSRHADLIKSHGIKLIPIKISRRSKNPFKEILILYTLLRIYLSEKPDIVHHVALKPVVYGTLIARICGIKSVVNALAGLGFLFVSKRSLANILRLMVEFALRILLNRPNVCVIFQNPEDLSLLINRKILASNQAVLIRGSGVDTSEFNCAEDPKGKPLVLLASRMLWNKGIKEFVEAACQLTRQNVPARFVLVGEGDPENPASIPESQLERWHSEGVVEWWGKKQNMPQVFAESHIVCLPTTYGEGLPKVLLEAASCSRPIVATNVPGCREIVHDGINGYLVPAGDIQSLVEAIRKLIETPELRREMGEQGRAIVLRDFSIQTVIRQTLALYRRLSES